MLLNKFKLPNNLLLLVIIIFALFYSLQYYVNWNTDYSFYYIGSNYLDNEYRLYKEHDESKGPAYLLFLRVITTFIGYGPHEALAGLYLTVLLYLLTIFYIAKKIINNQYKVLTVVILSFGFLAFHDGNSSIALFQGAFLLNSFFFLCKYNSNAKIKYLILSFFFLSISFFTRIDTLIFLPIFFFIISKKKNLYLIFYHLFLALITIILIYVIFVAIYKFNLNEFWLNNYTYNKTVVAYDVFNIKSKIFILKFREKFFLFFLKTGIIFYLLYLFFNLNKRDFSCITNILLGVFFLVFGIFFNVYSESSELKHITIIYIPAIFLIILFLKKDCFYFNYFNNILLIFVFYFSIFSEATKTIKTFKEYHLDGCFKDHFCNKSSLFLYKDVIEDLNNNNNEYVIINYENAWIYLFVKKYSNNLITQRFYQSNKELKMLKSQHLLTKHNSYLNKDYKQFYISNEIINDPNELSKQLIEKLILIKKFKLYTKFVVNNNY